jgi:sulfite oxidase
MLSPCRRLVHDPDGLNTGCWPIPAEYFVTPSALFFTRSHAPTPNIDPATWRLEVSGLVERPRSFTLDQLLDFPERHEAATLVCAGLRRDEFLPIGPLPGELPWGPEAASTGMWTGISLADVLRTVGVSPQARYVEFIGLDRCERQGQQFGFGGSIEVAKAHCPEVLLASRLNGAALAPEHGFPVRVVVPGWIGARSVKWLGQIRLSEQPSNNYFQSRAYRFQRETNPKDLRDVTGGVALTEVPLNSVILEPTADQKVRAGRVAVRGWAMGSGGRPLASIEVSADEGRNWTAARIAVDGRRWTWTFWETTVELAPGTHTLMVRATDSAGTRQPVSPWETWNVKGYSNNAWHRVTIRAVEPETAIS